MPRGHLIVRVPEPGDIPAVLTMWEELRSTGGRGAPLAPAASEATVTELLAKAKADTSHRIVVAELDGEVVGLAVFVAKPIGPLVPSTVLHIDYLHVRPAFHRRGVGGALVAAAASFGEEAGAEHVVVNVAPHVREANRFYAKLGFTPMVVRRVVSVATLRRRLGAAVVNLDGMEVGRRAGLMARRRSALGRSRANLARAASQN